MAYRPTGIEPTAAESELIEILAEESAEIIQAAMKVLRFGIGDTRPGGELDNIAELSAEVGDLLEMVDRCIAAGIISQAWIDFGKRRKSDRLAEFLQHG